MSSSALPLARRFGNRGGAALPLLAGAGIMTAGLALHGPLRVAVELPLALLLPGIAVLAAARGATPARPATDAGLAVTLSCAAWILVVLACFVLGQPLTTVALALGADLLVVTAAAVCALRAGPLSTLVGSSSPGRAMTAQVLLLGVVVGASCAAVAVGASDGPAPEPYSEVALAGRWAQVASPVMVTAKGPVAVGLVVANHTQVVRRYTLEPAMRGGHWPARTIRLGAGKRWQGSVQGTVPAGGCLHRLLVTVREEGSRLPVGTLTLWFQNGTILPGACTP